MRVWLSLIGLYLSSALQSSTLNRLWNSFSPSSLSNVSSLTEFVRGLFVVFQSYCSCLSPVVLQVHDKTWDCHDHQHVKPRDPAQCWHMKLCHITRGGLQPPRRKHPLMVCCSRKKRCFWAIGNTPTPPVTAHACAAGSSWRACTAHTVSNCWPLEAAYWHLREGQKPHRVKSFSSGFHLWGENELTCRLHRS